MTDKLFDLYQEAVQQTDQDGQDGIAASILVLAQAVAGVGSALRALGNNNAATDMGAIESATVEIESAIRDAASTIASALTEAANV